MTALVASLLAGQTLLAWWIARRDRAHAAVAGWSAAIGAAAIARAVLEAIGGSTEALETAGVAIAAFGLWATSARVMGHGRPAIAIVAGVVVMCVGLHAGVAASARAWIHTGAWAFGVLGASWPIHRALGARRATEPRAAHFVVLAYAAVGATELALHGVMDWQTDVPVALGAGASVMAQGAWIVTSGSRRTADVGDRAEHPRAIQRGGDLVDVAPPVRGRDPRGARAEGGHRES